MTQHSASHDRKMILSLREQLTQRWVQRRLGGIGHERRVTALASTFFGLLEDLHGLGAEYRRILRLGCMVHDVGRSVEDRRHRTIGRSRWEGSGRKPKHRASRKCQLAICL